MSDNTVLVPTFFVPVFILEGTLSAFRRGSAATRKGFYPTSMSWLDAASTIARYKSLADIERGFRVLTSELEIGSVYHRLSKRIRAHAAICFIALAMHRVMRQRLKAAGHAYSPDRALQLLRQIQNHRVRLPEQKTVNGISNISEEQADLYRALKLRKPNSQNVQLSLF